MTTKVTKLKGGDELVEITAAVYCSFYLSDVRDQVEAYNKDADEEDRFDPDEMVEKLLRHADWQSVLWFVDVHEHNVDEGEFIRHIIEEM